MNDTAKTKSWTGMVPVEDTALAALAILPATSHTAVITQVDLLMGFIDPFLKGVTPKGFFGP